jgi:hypothetical protein
MMIDGHRMSRFFFPGNEETQFESGVTTTFKRNGQENQDWKPDPHLIKVIGIDVNNDDIGDLIGFSDTHQLKVYLGTESGVWTMTSQVFNGITKDFSISDFDLDGYIDIVLAQSTKIQTRINDGAGIFINQEELTLPGTNKVVKADDLDASGRSDVVIGNTEGMVVKKNDQEGETEELQVLESGDTNDVKMADFNGDGKKEIVTVTITGENLIWKKNEEGLFVDSGQNVWTYGTESLDIIDINDDDCLDITVTDQYGYQVVFINDCLGNFSVQN